MIATMPANQTRTAKELVAPVADEIRLMAPQAEAARRLPDELVECLKDAGLFSIYTPGEFGGLELPLPQALRVVEEVARHDGSTGWTVALGVANILFTSVLPEASAARVLGNGAALIAGAPAFGVRAMRVDGSSEVRGVVRDHAEWRTVTVAQVDRALTAPGQHPAIRRPHRGRGASEKFHGPPRLVIRL